jgi:hypothetical protein
MEYPMGKGSFIAAMERKGIAHEAQSAIEFLNPLLPIATECLFSG